MAMAHRAKAALANMEFVQFHPTSLYNTSQMGGRSFLISEAVRGEGGLLLNRAGDRFMERCAALRHAFTRSSHCFKKATGAIIHMSIYHDDFARLHSCTPNNSDIIRPVRLHRYDERLELAPRDIVARAIHDQLQTHGDKHVLLDISHRPSAEVLAHFPNIAAECGKAGIDVTKDPIPVVPAQHYMCGGVRTGLYGAPPAC